MIASRYASVPTVTRVGVPASTNGVMSDRRSVSLPKNWPPELTNGSVPGPRGALVAR
jgi:hypothetical protein